MLNLYKKHWSLLWSVVSLWSIIFVLLTISYGQNQGHIVYSLDDAYIHMAMAKNFSLHGVWGITKYEFTSSSSSLFWTTLLAFIYLIFKPNITTPLILNIFFASLVIVSIYFLLRKYNIKPLYRFFILISLIFVTPLPPLVFTGLEHVLHILISILFVYVVSEELLKTKVDKRRLMYLITLSVLLPVIRYEGIVLVFASCILFMFRKKILLSILMLFFSSLPVFIFGVISINKGWSFFPNSLLLKGSFPDVTSFKDFIDLFELLANTFIPSKYIVIFIISFLVILGFIIFILYYRNRKIFFKPTTSMVILLAVNIILYAAYSKSGWSYRYQSFLIAFCIVVISIVLFEHMLKDIKNFFSTKILLTLFLILVPYIYFSILAFDLINKTPQATTNIYEQQYQMGMFLKRYYENKSVALNDIGTSNYFADIKCVDLWGLGNNEVSKKKRMGFYTVDDILVITKANNVSIAILYDSWFKEGNGPLIPKEWIKIGEWKILNNIIAGDDTVSFYAVDSSEEEILLKNLRLYSKVLPASVIQSGKYLN